MCTCIMMYYLQAVLLVSIIIQSMFQFEPPTKDGYHGDRYIQDDMEHDFTQREFVPLR